MKTMTCRQLGGPCDLEHHGETADDVINAQDRHLKEAEKAGDASHQEARDAMKGRWRHPKKAMGWYKDVKTTFAELPDRLSAAPPSTSPQSQGDRPWRTPSPTTDSAKRSGPP